MKYAKQVSPTHYSHDIYMTLNRWISYFYQIRGVNQISKNWLQKEPEKLSIFEIGVGDKTVSNVLKQYGYRVTTMDIDSELNPDIVAALPKVPLKGKVDIIICCEVLEHLSYSDAEKALLNIRGKSRFAIISVPHKSPTFSVAIHIPFFRTAKLLIPIPTPFIKHRFDGEHYWELGARYYSVSRFKATLTKVGMKCFMDYRVFDYPYHHFFLVQCK